MHNSSRITLHASRAHVLTFPVVTVTLLLVYALTLAPTVTLWDAGEFNAAIASLGIPHPPGTPLYIVIGSTWTRMLGFLPQAFAVNLLSAVATAVACGLLAGLVSRWTKSSAVGIAAGLSSGTMLAVWQNATETEVYALSMLLGVLMVVVGERAGARGDARLRVLLAYLIGLAVPVQISALVAAPAAVFLASMAPGATRPEWRTLFSSGAVVLLAAGAGLASAGLTLAGAILLVVVVLRADRSFRREAFASVGVVIVALTPVLFMLIRAAHDPLVNQGNPATIGALADVISRAQYQTPGLWPRSAPLWVQLVNLVQYADWQVASGLDPSVEASWRRTPFSIAALLLAVAGWRRLRSMDRRGAWGAGVLLLMSSLGVVAVLNLRAGPSILDAILPPGSTHEPRERDYFFALAFATTGLFVGIGAFRLAQRLMSRLPGAVATIAVTVAFLPVLLNWSAANRRPEGHIADALGESLLASVPRNAVLLLAGDNDTYTTWYRQAALDDRRDVVPVTISLLPVGWYRQELQRRHQLFAPDDIEEWRGTQEVLLDLAAGAQRTGRPLAAAVSVSAGVRGGLAPGWTLGGTAYLADPSSDPRDDAIDTAAVEKIANLVTPKLPAGVYRGRDPAVGYVVRLLNCPIQALRTARAASGTNAGPSLDPRCNFK